MSTNSATAFAGPADPKDKVDYVAGFSNLLEEGETISAGFTVVASAAATALGFKISTSPAIALTDMSKSIVFWVEVEVANQLDAPWSDDGTVVEIETTFNTSASRTFQRTWQITVKQL